MKRLFIPAMAMILMATACGSPKAPVGVANRLSTEVIISVQTRAPGGEWSRNRLNGSLNPGASASFPETPGEMEIMATDNLGRTYSYQGPALTREGMIWEITAESRTQAAEANSWAGECPVTITNELGAWSVTRILCSPSTSSSWGESWITEPLNPGESVTFSVRPDTYDIRVEDSDGDTYTLWAVMVTPSGYTWRPTLEDIDSSGG